MLSKADKDARRNAQEKLEMLLQEGLDSGSSTPMTAQDWQEVRLSSKRLVPPVPSCFDNPCEAE